MTTSDSRKTAGGGENDRAWRPLVAGLLYALIAALAFPPFGVWPLTLLSLMPLVWVVARTGRPGISGKQAFRAGVLVTLGGLPGWLFQERWLIDVALPGYPLLALYMSAYVGAFVWLAAVVRRAMPRLPLAVVVPVLWTAMEWLRGDVVLTGYPWFSIAQPLIELAPLAAPAAVLGVYGVTFLLAALTGAAADLAGWSGVPRRVGVIGVGATAASWAVLAAIGWSTSTPSGGGPQKTVRVAVIQTNVPQDNKIGWTIKQRLADFDRFIELTRQAAAATPRPDIILWPETMFPGDALNPEAVEAARRLGLKWSGDEQTGGRDVAATEFADRLFALQRELGIPMVVGSQSIEGLRTEPTGQGRSVRLAMDRRYNSVMVVTGGRVPPAEAGVGGGGGGRYDKMGLTPFGELIPVLWRWPALQQAVVSVGAKGMSFDLAWGRQPVAVTVPLASDGAALRLATPICFEATWTALTRALVYNNGGRRADAIVNLSNDGWFGRWSGGREQHLLAARWRTVELGVPMVRAVNTGVSAYIDTRGRMIRSGPDGLAADIRVDGIMLADVALSDAAFPGTIYGRTGSIFPWVTVAAAAGLVSTAIILGRRARRNPPVTANPA